MIRLLVVLHIVSGAAALLAMAGALCTVKGGGWHRRMGKCYTVAMAIALTLAAVVSLLTANMFLFLIGIFSGYFVYTGWRLTQVRDGTRSRVDRFSSTFMLCGSILMVAYGLYLFTRGESPGIALGVFGIFALHPAWVDFRRSQWPVGKDRIFLHLNRMGGASIATVTAAFVVNIKTNPAFIAWLLPTIIGVPIIIYWGRRVMRPSINTP